MGLHSRQMRWSEKLWTENITCYSSLWRAERWRLACCCWLKKAVWTSDAPALNFVETNLWGNLQIYPSLLNDLLNLLFHNFTLQLHYHFNNCCHIFGYFAMCFFSSFFLILFRSPLIWLGIWFDFSLQFFPHYWNFKFFCVCLNIDINLSLNALR